jgi:hypothetical protein
MAVLDNQLVMSDAQAVTASAPSTNVIDLSKAKSLGASGTPLYVDVRVGTGLGSSGSATIDVALQGSNTEGSGYVNLLAAAQFAVAAGVAGLSILKTPLPAQAVKYRYLRVNYTIGTANLNAGTFNAHITTAPN